MTYNLTEIISIGNSAIHDHVFLHHPTILGAAISLSREFDLAQYYVSGTINAVSEKKNRKTKPRSRANKRYGIVDGMKPKLCRDNQN